MVNFLMIISKNKNKFEIKSDDKYKSYENEYIIECINLNLWYEKIQALKDINIKFKKNKVTAIIGPSGCGKSTLLRCLNRMNDVIEGCNIKGVVLFNEKNIYENKYKSDKSGKCSHFPLVENEISNSQII